MDVSPGRRGVSSWDVDAWRWSRRANVELQSVGFMGSPKISMILQASTWFYMACLVSLPSILITTYYNHGCQPLTKWDDPSWFPNSKIPPMHLISGPPLANPLGLGAVELCRGDFGGCGPWHPRGSRTFDGPWKFDPANQLIGFAKRGTSQHIPSYSPHASKPRKQHEAKQKKMDLPWSILW